MAATRVDPVHLTKHLLIRAKQLDAARAPKPDPSLPGVWAEMLHTERFPPQLWKEAVDYWAMNPQIGALSVGVLSKCALHVRDQWEAQPEKREILEEARTARLSARIARGELPPGSGLESPRDERTAPNSGLAEMKKQLRKIIAEAPATKKHDISPEQALANLDALVARAEDTAQRQAHQRERDTGKTA